MKSNRSAVNHYCATLVLLCNGQFTQAGGRKEPWKVQPYCVEIQQTVMTKNIHRKV